MKRMVGTAVTVAALALALGACSSGNAQTSGSTSTTSAKTAAVVVPELGAISITDQGFTPEWPIVPLNQDVTFTNETKTPQQIVFDNERDASGAFVSSPVLPPGATWVYTAKTFTSLAYHSPNLPGAVGRIQVDPPAEPEAPEIAGEP